MASGQYGSTANPVTTLGMLVQAGVQIKVGTQELWGSLETTSDTYTNYTAPIGLTASSYDLGEVGELGATINATVEPFESVNVRQPTIYFVTEEEFTINASVSQFDYRTIETMLHHGVMRLLDAAPNNEYLYTWGGSCAIKYRPVSLGVTNIACYLPASQDAQLGVTGMIMTMFHGQTQTGLVWDNITADEIDTLDLEWAGIPVTSLPNGGNQGSLYLF